MEREPRLCGGLHPAQWRLATYPTKLGLPVDLASLQDHLFENPADDRSAAADFALRFLEVIPIGADCTQIADRFMLRLLNDTEHGMLPLVAPKKAGADKRVHAAIEAVIALFERRLAGDEPTLQE